MNQLPIPRVFALLNGTLHRIDFWLGNSFYSSCAGWGYEQIIHRDSLPKVTRDKCVFFTGVTAELLNMLFHSPRPDIRDFCSHELNLSNYKEIVRAVPAQLWAKERHVTMNVQSV